MENQMSNSKSESYNGFGIRQSGFVLYELVLKGIRLKYRRSYLGIIWSLLEPLLTMIVLTAVFGTLFNVNDRSFPVYILAGRLLYGFFSQSTTAALKSIRANAGIIRKIYVPKLLYPLSAVIFNFAIFLISLIVLVAVAVVRGVYPTIYLFQSVPVLINLFILCTGTGILMSTVGVFFRDMEYLWNIVLMMIMYTSAIFYIPDKLLTSRWGFLLKLNPLYCCIANFREAIFGQGITVSFFIYSLCFGAIAVLAGYIIFKKNEDKFILYI